MKERWREFRVSDDATHHTFRGRPAYPSRFHEVLKFHEPGLAPVLDASGAYHINPDGQSAYYPRHIRTFGFYEQRAAVHSDDGWFHILPDGSPLYGERYAWCGNFQEARCAVRLPGGGYFHLRDDGAPAYGRRYGYAGDFRDGHAVVQREDGRHTHVDVSGDPLHGRWFDDLDVFHKGTARACDSMGWHHVRMNGEPLYEARFRYVEPFYNGQARVEGLDGSLSVIDESGQTLVELRRPLQSNLEGLSGDMVGLWRTQTIRAAVELGVFELLPSSAEEIEQQLRMHATTGTRLMRALAELSLVWRDTDGFYHATERGSLLVRSHTLSLADAALHWGRESYEAWAEITASLLTEESSFETLHGNNFFDWIRNRPGDLQAYHAAMATYARHDYSQIATIVDFSAHDSVLDAGGGTGELAFSLLRSCPRLRATVMDRPEVIETARVPADLEGRCRFVEGDLFQKWPVESEAVILARVVHDWPDSDALRILKRAHEAMAKDAMLYVVEMVLDNETGAGGLLDLNMLVMTGGAERTEKQFDALLAEAGFGLLDVIETHSVSSVIVAKAQ